MPRFPPPPDSGCSHIPKSHIPKSPTDVDPGMPEDGHASIEEFIGCTQPVITSGCRLDRAASRESRDGRLTFRPDMTACQPSRSVHDLVTLCAPSHHWWADRMEPVTSGGGEARDGFSSRIEPLGGHPHRRVRHRVAIGPGPLTDAHAVRHQRERGRHRHATRRSLRPTSGGSDPTRVPVSHGGGSERPSGTARPPPYFLGRPPTRRSSQAVLFHAC